MRFELHIDVGNVGMETPSDVSWALRKVALNLEREAFFDDDSTYILDVNGNVVGHYKTKYI